MALYADGDYRGAAAKAQALVASDEKAGFMSGENLIRLWATSCIKQDDTAGYRAALEVMVRYYPSRDYWQDLILRTAREDQLPREFALDVYRLLRSTANLRDARSYTKMAELAIDAGLPGEARSVIDEGYKRGILGVGEDKDVFLQKSLRMNIESQCRHDAEALPNLDRMAGLADTGEPLLSNGLAHVTYGEAEKGLAMMMQGLQKGGLTSPDLAQLHLGFAYYASAHRQHARETFAKVTSAEGPAHLARLWRILVDQPPLPYP